MAYGLDRMAWAPCLLNNLFRRLNDIDYENRFYEWSDPEGDSERDPEGGS